MDQQRNILHIDIITNYEWRQSATNLVLRYQGTYKGQKKNMTAKVKWKILNKDCELKEKG